MPSEFYDAVIVGAGFSGIQQLYLLLRLGLTVKVIDKASGPGGTWYWNRYPGAPSNRVLHSYGFSWDRYKMGMAAKLAVHGHLDAQEILEYLEGVVKRHELQNHIQFNTSVLLAKWNDDARTWTVETSDGVFACLYFITAVGLVTEPSWPSIPSRSTFQGDLLHVACWPKQYQLEGKKVAVIRSGDRRPPEQELFNRENADFVDVAENLIANFTTHGIKLVDGEVHEVDVVICTNEDNDPDGPYSQIYISGRSGLPLSEHWMATHSSNMGLAVNNFPNLFMVNGPLTPQANPPIAIESQSEFIEELIAYAEKRRADRSITPVIESKVESDFAWGMTCTSISDRILSFQGTDVDVDVRPTIGSIFTAELHFHLQMMLQSRETAFASFRRS
ncbi:hypothetical protein BJX70DRAFT_396944 [Aspergillus crustosus]